MQQTKQVNSYSIANAEAVFDNYIRRYHMNELKSKLAKGNYYSVLVMDGSTDKVIVEQETINILFLHSGVPKLKYSSVENVKSADTEGILQSLRIAFERTGIKNLEDSIVGLHVDRASVNTGRKRGLRNAP